MINIIDGFYLGSSTPIDSRFLVSNSSARIAIEYKYDGLKVFQSDTREEWIWNSSILDWELNSSGSITGTGSQNYLAKWGTSSNIKDSNIYSTGSVVGINSTNPLSTLQINGSSQPVSIHNGSSGGILGYNWYYSLGDQFFNTSIGSSNIIMNNGSFVFKTRGSSASSLQSNFELNSNGYNFMQSPGNGNFISGSVSFGTSSVPYSTNQLVTINGSLRSNSSSYNKVTYITYNGTFFSKQIGFNVNGSISSMSTVSSGSSYTIVSDDHNIVVRTNASISSSWQLTLPTLSLTDSNQIGREISIVFESPSYTSNYFSISSSTSIIGMDGSIYTPSLKVGESIRLVSYLQGTTPYWKVFSYNKSNSPETWKLVGATGSMMNGQSIPSFISGSSNRSGYQPLRLRKKDDQYFHIQGSIVNNSISYYAPIASICILPIGYRPLLKIEYPILFTDSSSIGYKGKLTIMDSGLIYVSVCNGEITALMGTVSWNFDIDGIIPID